LPTIGVSELLIIGFLLVLVFGASRLPSLGEGAGRAVGKLLRSARNDHRIDVRKTDQQSSVSDGELVAPSQPDDEKAPPKA